MAARVSAVRDDPCWVGLQKDGGDRRGVGQGQMGLAAAGEIGATVSQIRRHNAIGAHKHALPQVHQPSSLGTTLPARQPHVAISSRVPWQSVTASITRATVALGDRNIAHAS